MKMHVVGRIEIPLSYADEIDEELFDEIPDAYLPYKTFEDYRAAKEQEKRNEIGEIKRYLSEKYGVNRMTYHILYECESCHHIQERFFNECPSCGEKNV